MEPRYTDTMGFWLNRALNKRCEESEVYERDEGVFLTSPYRNGKEPMRVAYIRCKAVEIDLRQ